MKLTLIEKRRQTPSIYSFIFKPEYPITFIPGQFITLFNPHDNSDERGIKRHFSIASSPTEKNIMIATKIIDNGSSFKKALLALEEGSNVEAGEPHGSFILPEDENNHCLFITGGIGITPVRSMVKYATDKKLNLKLTLLYSNVMSDEIAFYEFFNELKTHNPKLDIVYTITKPEELKQSWTGRVGRIDEALIREYMKNNLSNKFYISGPPQMVTAMLELLKSIGVDDQDIKRELFTGY